MLASSSAAAPPLASTSSRPTAASAACASYDWVSPAGARCVVATAIDQTNSELLLEQQQAQKMFGGGPVWSQKEAVRESVVDILACVVDELLEKTVIGAAAYSRHRRPQHSTLETKDIIRYLGMHTDLTPLQHANSGNATQDDRHDAAVEFVMKSPRCQRRRKSVVVNQNNRRA